MGSATYRHSYPTCGKPSYPALYPDPLEQENYLPIRSEIIMCFESWHILKRFRLSISNLCQLTCDELSSECSEKCHVRGKCVVLLWPQVTICFCKNLELVEPMKNSTCYFAHVWCCVAFPVTLAFWPAQTRCGAHLNVKLERKRKNW